ncbi:MAG: hypothetical protein EZS28_012691 [Streblomastix strix]|uniref:Uncharacterized protein n=1 Tax=Streblomastix strix TaxID=222440 RepID=A0A5J4WAV5_9EUKA|nr:MAG: hypothetical protein EZS28_012691 [Streblomastix strix]
MATVRPINESDKFGSLYTELITKLKDLNHTGSRTNFDNVLLFLEQQLGQPFQQLMQENDVNQSDFIEKLTYNDRINKAKQRLRVYDSVDQFKVKHEDEAIKAIKRVSKFKNNEAIAEVVYDEVTYKLHYFNKLTKQEQLSQYADKVYDSYKGLPFNVQIDFGVLLQRKLDGENYEYSCRIPSLDNAYKHQLSTITDKKSLEQFKVDTFKYLRELMERSYDDTKNLIVGIFNVMFATYKLIDTGT